MKSNLKTILGCALAAGLTTFAASKVQAAQAEIFTPLHLKLIVSYTTGNDTKVHKLRINSKDILKELSKVAYDGENFKGDKLATQVGDAGEETESVFIIHGKNDVLEVPSEDGFMALGFQELNHNEKDSAHGFKYAETGLITLNFYSSPQFTEEEGTVSFDAVPEPTPGEPSGFDQISSEDDSDIWLEFTGNYAYKEKGHDGKNAENLSTHLNAILTGQGFDSDLNDDDNLSVDGKLSGNASGPIIEAD
jgi:hypothetical protein